MKHVAIIPARAGSKSIINKNLVKLDERETLVDRAIRLGKEAKIFSRIIVTTDIPCVIDDYKDDMLVDVRVRPEDLCTDEARMYDTIKDCIETYKINDWIWLLQPTSPFRTAYQMRSIKPLVMSNVFSSFISVVDVGANHPNRVYKRKNKKLFPIIKTNFDNKQELPELFIRNGLYYIFKPKDLIDHQSFYITPCYGIVFDEYESVNIDGPRDLQMARIVYKEMSYGRVH